MHITQRANRLMVSHVTGPTHNFLEFTVERTIGSPADVPLMVFDHPSGTWPLQAVRQAVLDGIVDGGGCDELVVRSFRILGSDTPDAAIYRHLARSLTEHMRRNMQSNQIEALG